MATLTILRRHELRGTFDWEPYYDSGGMGSNRAFKFKRDQQNVEMRTNPEPTSNPTP